MTTKVDYDDLVSSGKYTPVEGKGLFWNLANAAGMQAKGKGIDSLTGNEDTEMGAVSKVNDEIDAQKSGTTTKVEGDTYWEDLKSGKSSGHVDDSFGSDIPDDGQGVSPSDDIDEPATETKDTGDDFIPADLSGDMPTGSMSGDMDVPSVPEGADVPVPTDSGTGNKPTMTPWEVTEEQTVMGLSEEYYDRDSPFFEKARQSAIRSSLAGGGQNSAMAAGFGELAAMDTAFKAAQQDAGTYARSAEFNAAMSNQFGLAEQRFIHNALLSDQSFAQAKVLEQMRIEAQFENIILDYKGRSNLIDQQLEGWFATAAQQHQYALDMLYEETDMQMSLNNMLQLSNFYIAGFQSVMQAANNPNLTPEQSTAAMQQGMAYLRQQWDFLASFLGNYRGGGDAAQINWLGSSQDDPYNWWSFPPPNQFGGGDEWWRGGVTTTGG